MSASVQSRSQITVGQRLLALPVFLLLSSHIFFYLVQISYGQLIGLGEYLWDEYYLLRTDAPSPTCSVNGIEEQLDAYLFSVGVDNEFGDLFEDSSDEDALRISLGKQHALCVEKQRNSRDLQERVTGTLKVFRAVDHFLLALNDFGRNRRREIFGLLLFLCAATTSINRAHICFRPSSTIQDYRAGALGEQVANLALCYSAYHYLVNGQMSSVGVQYPQIRWLYLIGFATLFCISLFHYLRRPSCVNRRGSALKAALCIPIYSYIAVIATVFQVVVRQNPQAVMLYIERIMDFADIFTNVALYIWVGMLLKQSRIAELVFAVVRPWKLSPEALASLTIVIMAVPTAYTGASGVIIIAMGGIIYNELRLSGARLQLAAAATAIAGSSGVVLRPCLLVVMIAALNKEVTTDQMFEWGGSVLLLTAGLFFLFARIGRRHAHQMTPARSAFKPSAAALLNLVPYVTVFSLVIWLFQLILGIRLDEFSAPVILPIAVLCILSYEKFLAHRVISFSSLSNDLQPAVSPGCDSTREGYCYRGAVEFSNSAAFEQSVSTSASDGVVLMGAILILMALSLAAGGVVADSGLINNTESWLTSVNIPVGIALLLIILVLIGMFMDPFGAVMLVSQTLAPMAYQLGVEPLHFWMITLVAFELGYLSPPVAVNHLLVRRIMGEYEFRRAQQAVVGRSFWIRHERILLPLVTLGFVLLLVAYAPLIQPW